MGCVSSCLHHREQDDGTSYASSSTSSTRVDQLRFVSRPSYERNRHPTYPTYVFYQDNNGYFVLPEARPLVPPPPPPPPPVRPDHPRPEGENIRGHSRRAPLLSPGHAATLTDESNSSEFAGTHIPRGRHRRRRSASTTTSSLSSSRSVSRGRRHAARDEGCARSPPCAPCGGLKAPRANAEAAHQQRDSRRLYLARAREVEYPHRDRFEGCEVIGESRVGRRRQRQRQSQNRDASPTVADQPSIKYSIKESRVGRTKMVTASEHHRGHRQNRRDSSDFGESRVGRHKSDSTNSHYKQRHSSAGRISSGGRRNSGAYLPSRDAGRH